MARAVDTIHTRLAALLAGTYTTGGRYVTGATFTEAKPISSAASPEWQDVVKDRMWSVAWPSQGDEGDAPQNTFQGPHILEIAAPLLVQYALDRAGSFEGPPSGPQGPLGLENAATRRAMGDAEQLRWILAHTPVWSGVAIGCTVGKHTTQAAGLRVILTLPLLFLVSVSAVTAPGWT